MRSTQIMTVSLPPEMLEQFEKVRLSEHRTRSELVREALRVYFYYRFPVVEPTKTELAAIRQGRSEIARGEYVTFKQLHNDLESSRRKTRAKSSRKNTH